MTGRSRWSWRRDAYEGKIASVKLGAKLFIPISEIRRVVAETPDLGWSSNDAGLDSATLADRQVNTSPDLAAAALDYAARGWLVIALHSPMARGCSCGWAECASPAKHPRTLHGLKDASRDPATIREWWRHWPEANIGIVTGPESGILVLDVDGKRGEESLIDFERRGLHLPDTWVVRTGGGGQHLYFIWPEGAEVRNSQSKIAPGLDIRGAGGYAVAPPSLHSSGARYEVDESAIPAVCTPEWLLSLIREHAARQDRQSEPAPEAVVEHPNRTPHLLSLAGTMNRRGMKPAAIEAALLAENAATCSLPLPMGKVQAIARDIPARYPNPKSDPEVRTAVEPDLLCLADVEARRVEWLWEPFIPARMLSMISGDPAAGKSFIALAVAADLSRGRLRDGRMVDPASTLYLTCENPVAECIRPRFDSLGGNPAPLHLLQGTRFAVDGEEQRGAVSLATVGLLTPPLSRPARALSSWTPCKVTLARMLIFTGATKPGLCWTVWQSSRTVAAVRYC